MHVIDRDQYVFSFSAKNTPALRIQSGDRVLLRTQDCFSGQIQKDEDLVTSIDYSQINPATGPVYVEGAKPGDVLKVEIVRIAVEETGVISTMPDIGTLIHQSEIRSRAVRIIDGKTIVFSERIQLPCSPMIGVIGVAPGDGEIPCGHPGTHGGNLDSTCIAEGAIVYLPVFVEGALFGLGDLHAAMGDGEIVGTGIETAGEVEVRLTVMRDAPGLEVPTPIVETADAWHVLSSHHDMLTAIRTASEIMQHLVADRWGMSMTDAYLLMGAVADVQASQCCKPCPVETVARIRLPKLPEMPSLLGG